MKELLELIRSGFTTPINAIIIIVMFIAAIKGVYEFIKWIKAELNEWYTKKYTTDEKKENIEERIIQLEKNDEKQFKILDEFSKSLSTIDGKLDDLTSNQAQEAVALTRASLNNMYPILKEQGYLTKSQYETWSNLADIYLARGGNHVFAQKIIPEIEKLEVKDI